jgi:hypothetical protein
MKPTLVTGNVRFEDYHHPNYWSKNERFEIHKHTTRHYPAGSSLGKSGEVYARKGGV